MIIKCSVFIAASLDGFIARENGGLDWLTGNEKKKKNEDYGYKEFYDSIDTLVLGRKTFETALTFEEWPYAGKKVVVLSSGSPKIPERLSADIAIMSGTPHDLVRQLHEKGARHLYVDGGRTIQGFLSAGLIQEMTITRIPVLIGACIPLFGKLDHDIKLVHIRTKTYENGFVQSKYGITGAA